MYSENINRIAIIGGGAAGFFAAINAKENHPNTTVVIFEKSNKLLSKVKISGGGRCNVTNGCSSIKALCQAYPRGGKALKKLFPVFNTRHAMAWFESRGVPLVIQEDGCVFPVSQDSQSIIDCFLSECRRLGIQIVMGKGISAIGRVGDQWDLDFEEAELPQGQENFTFQENSASFKSKTVKIFDKIIIATGGSPKRKGLDWLEALGHKIEDPVPSLFTFNMPDEPVKKLMGIVVENTLVSIQGTKLKSEGPLLITHWGMSGPAILKLSSFGARILSEVDYNFSIQVNWVGQSNFDRVFKVLSEIERDHGQKFIANYRPFELPERLWHFLLEKCDLNLKKKWAELGNKGMNKLVNLLTNDSYTVKGKTTFKEEFVTCGGINLDSIDLSTMQSKVCKNLYFAGEVLDIDGITGGYNFQAAWTTAFIAAKLN